MRHIFAATIPSVLAAGKFPWGCSNTMIRI